MKQLILKIKEVQPGGFFQKGYILTNPILREGDKEIDLGDFLVTSKSDDKRLRALAEKYQAEGYELIGDWNI